MIVERQFFYQNKFYLLLLVALFFIIAYHFFTTEKEVSDIINHTIPLAILSSIAVLSLRISIDKNKITYQWVWLGLIFFKKNVISSETIQEIKIVKYNFFEGGLGYGIRYSKKYGNIYNVYGNIGLALKTSERRLLIGIQKKNIIKEFLHENFSSLSK